MALKVEDYYPRQKRRWLRLHEENDKVSEISCHHKLAQYLDAYIQAAGIAEDRKGVLFRSAMGKTKMLNDKPMSCSGAWAMVRRRRMRALKR